MSSGSPERSSILFMRGLVRKARAWIAMEKIRCFSQNNLSVPAIWLRQPDIFPGDLVCLIVILARGGKIPLHSAYQINKWISSGFKVVAIVVGPMDLFVDHDSLSRAVGILLRENRGYDFGAWAAAINRIPALRGASVVAVANDSLLGPFDGFNAMIERVKLAEADVIGTVESNEIKPHFQSFLIFFKTDALKSFVFWRFWRKIRTGSRDFVVKNYETNFSGLMKRHGLRCLALFPADPADKSNQTLLHWETLVESGFPYVKVSLLRDNPYEIDLGDWRSRLRGWGYDPNLAEPLLEPVSNLMRSEPGAG